MRARLNGCRNADRFKNFPAWFTNRMTSALPAFELFAEHVGSPHVRRKGDDVGGGVRC